MKYFNRRIKVILLLLIIVVAWFFLFHMTDKWLYSDSWHFEKQIKGHNLKEVLRDSRIVISNSDALFIGDDRIKGSRDEDGIYLDRELLLTDTNIPCTLKSFNPYWIYVRKEYLVISLNVYERRIWMVAFSEGANQFGNQQVMNGLWFWNGKGKNIRSPGP